MKKWYGKATMSSQFEFKFKNGEIKLDLDKKQSKDNWTILPHKHPCTVGIT